jgi:hypothetical protein
MSREAHVRFWESAGVKFPRATHFPLARQERILKRTGLTVTSQTLWDQLSALARRLDSASRALLARAFAEPVMGLDQTSWLAARRQSR